MKDKSKKPVSYTKTGKPFKICRITEKAIFITLPAGEQIVTRVNLEKAIKIINEGRPILTPTDYKQFVEDERPTYAWSILHDAGFV